MYRFRPVRGVGQPASRGARREWDGDRPWPHETAGDTRKESPGALPAADELPGRVRAGVSAWHADRARSACFGYLCI